MDIIAYSFVAAITNKHSFMFCMCREENVVYKIVCMYVGFKEGSRSATADDVDINMAVMSEII